MRSYRTDRIAENQPRRRKKKKRQQNQGRCDSPDHYDNYLSAFTPAYPSNQRANLSPYPERPIYESILAPVLGQDWPFGNCRRLILSTWILTSCPCISVESMSSDVGLPVGSSTLLVGYSTTLDMVALVDVAKRRSAGPESNARAPLIPVRISLRLIRPPETAFYRQIAGLPRASILERTKGNDYLPGAPPEKAAASNIRFAAGGSFSMLPRNVTSCQVWLSFRIFPHAGIPVQRMPWTMM